MGMRRLIALLVLAVLAFLSVAAGETEGRPDFATMRVKELQVCDCALRVCVGRRPWR